MRIIKQNDDDLAAEEAMRGGFIGAAKYCTVALFIGTVLQATSPRFRAIRPPQKGWMMVVAFLGGFGNASDTAFTNYERRDRETQIRQANKRRYDILYGDVSGLDDSNKIPIPATTASATETPTTTTPPSA
ncbi:hypothetical protein BGW38_001712 [Lunasporangiospora selenospora]|uniref:Uncharacterized protein n=1 Tax=Lunasporangiospora selenospora TaxID=979761 RepID=A0A9P6FV82_9FUNG|nr:hypothetical protein BGW38_001712 [Lunasporangiospora selenospora]